MSAPLPSGVSGIAASDAVVFPNPTSDLLWVRGQAPGTSARILSLDGRLLESRQADAGTVFSLQQYPAGVYLLQLINETGVRCLKVIRN
ncbi:MAG: T9SS type A sorting domain-containing protein [Candidatus Pollutiaquabacter aromativorans]